ncbi:hypothetical protein STEG23_006915 [Scotinomys teguina]
MRSKAVSKQFSSMASASVPASDFPQWWTVIGTCSPKMSPPPDNKKQSREHDTHIPKSRIPPRRQLFQLSQADTPKGIRRTGEKEGEFNSTVVRPDVYGLILLPDMLPSDKLLLDGLDLETESRGQATPQIDTVSSLLSCSGIKHSDKSILEEIYFGSQFQRDRERYGTEVERGQETGS